MESAQKGCENCGNYRCSQSVVAIYYNDCYWNDMKYWMPKVQAVEDILWRKRNGRRSKRKLRRAIRAYQSAIAKERNKL